MTHLAGEIKKVVPTKDEAARIDATARKILGLARAQSGKIPQITGVETGGSYAKGTWLGGSADIDVFVKMDRNTPRHTFTKLAKAVGYAVLDGYSPAERYAEHPYVEAVVDGTRVNVVPCYDVEAGGWISAADRSPYHTAYVKENMSADQKNEVRLLKRFLMTHQVYGAEIARRGFSGYVAEVLVLHFGGFLETVRGMAEIKRGDVIGRAARSFDTPVAIMDPVDDCRNLAAAISKRNMALFILACRSYLRNPAAGMLQKRVVPGGDWDSVVCVEFGYAKRSPDTLWGQARKAMSALDRQLELEGFSVLKRHVMVAGRVVRILFLLESLRLPKKTVRAGPDVFRREDAARFISRSGVMVWVSEDMKLLRLSERKYTHAAELLSHMLANPGDAGIPAGLHGDVRDFLVVEGSKLSQTVKREAADLLSADGVALSSC